MTVAVKGFDGMTVTDGDSLTVAVGQDLPILQEEPLGNASVHAARISFSARYDKDPDKASATGWDAFAQKTLKEVARKDVKESIGDGSIEGIEAWFKAHPPKDPLYAYASAFRHHSVSYRIVYPGSRYGWVPEPGQDQVDSLPHPVFFFPATQGYLDPFDDRYRYPYIDPDKTGVQALVLDLQDDDDPGEAMAAFRDIPTMPADSSVVETRRTIDLATGVGKETVVTSGYFGAAAKERDVSVAVHPKGVSMGALLDSLPRLEDVQPRRLPFDLPYPYTRAILLTLTIPAGYTLAPTAGLDTDLVYDGMRFTMAHRLDGQVLRIKLRQRFDRATYAPTAAAAFLGVYNAPADARAVLLKFQRQ
jgi:hypothetical protein